MVKKWGQDAAATAATTPADEYDPAAVTAETLRAGSNNGTNRRLLSFAERVERLVEEKQGLADDIKEVFAEAKGEGFDVKILRQAIRRRAMDKTDRQESDALLQLYEDALAEAEAASMKSSVAESSE